MYIVGITGGSGTGKTSAVNALQALGAKALDCDVIYHELLLSHTQMQMELETQFTDISTDGKIDRRKLGEKVFSDPDSLTKLNLITHKFILEEIEQRINNFAGNETKIIAIDAIALIESGQGEKCDIIIGITAPHENRISRIMERDNISMEQAKKRINAQKPDSFYHDNCDHILENNYDSQAEFEKKCIEFFKELKYE